MFFLKELPDNSMLDKFERSYEQMDALALRSCLQLLRSGSDVNGAFDELLARHGLSQGRFLLMIVIKRSAEERLKASQIAEQMGIKRPTVTGLIDALAKDEMVKRLANAADARSRHIVLTPKGEAKLREVLPFYYENINRIMAPLNPSEQQILIELLMKLQYN